jgi:processive 1,2-diacylglycerol beta-glucosyltransferase
MPRKKRILVASAHCGIGHTQAAAALKQVFDAEYGDSVEATLVDILDYGPSFFKKFYSGGYFWLADRHPEMWRRLYYKSKRRGRNTRFNLFIQNFLLRGFMKFVFDLEPDAVIGTHFLVREVLAPYAAKGRFTAPFYFCVTDFDMHPLHVGPEVAHYFVATEATRFSVHKNGGVPISSVTATGIPLRPQFAKETDPDEVRARLGIEKGAPTVLIMTSGFAQAGIPEMIDMIARIEPAARVVVICGRNERLKETLDSKEVPGSFKLVPLGYTENVAEIMSICNLML